MHEITEKGRLLDEAGNLREPGYARKLLLDYKRDDIKVSKLRIKEWDYYLIGNSRFALALTIADNSYMGLDSISFLWLEEGRQITKSPMQFMTKGRKRLPESSEKGSVFSKGKHYSIEFLRNQSERYIVFHMDHFSGKTDIRGQITLSEDPEESMVIATPFEKDGHFYYNQKINCMRANGYVIVENQKYEFRGEDSFAVLDWGRGVWTYENTWYWGSASGLHEGKPLGFNLGYGFGDTKAASENVIFYDGKIHKLSRVAFEIPHNAKGAEDYMSPWKFTSDDGRCEMDFVPVLDRSAKTSLLVIASDQHQVFGRFSGRLVLDDGSVIQIQDFAGFAEKVMNKW